MFDDKGPPQLDQFFFGQGGTVVTQEITSTVPFHVMEISGHFPK